MLSSCNDGNNFLPFDDDNDDDDDDDDTESESVTTRSITLSTVPNTIPKITVSLKFCSLVAWFWLYSCSVKPPTFCCTSKSTSTVSAAVFMEGNPVGAKLGTEVEGDSVAEDGLEEGTFVGKHVGIFVGDDEGPNGWRVGVDVGRCVGPDEGMEVGMLDGTSDG